MTDLQLPPGKTALLSMDLQSAIVSIYTKTDQSAFLSRVAKVLHWARGNQVLVVHVRVEFRHELPEVSASNPVFGPVKQSTQHQRLFAGPTGEIHAAVAPASGEIVVAKRRISAFWGTDLDMILRANGIQTLVLLGIATSGVVLSTALHACDADYRLVIVSDCCADLEPALHSSLIEHLFPRRGTVTTTDQLTTTALHSL